MSAEASRPRGATRRSRPISPIPAAAPVAPARRAIAPGVPAERRRHAPRAATLVSRSRSARALVRARHGPPRAARRPRRAPGSLADARPLGVLAAVGLALALRPARAACRPACARFSMICRRRPRVFLHVRSRRSSRAARRRGEPRSTGPARLPEPRHRPRARAPSSRRRSCFAARSRRPGWRGAAVGRRLRAWAGRSGIHAHCAVGDACSHVARRPRAPHRGRGGLRRPLRRALRGH